MTDEEALQRLHAPAPSPICDWSLEMANSEWFLVNGDRRVNLRSEEGRKLWAELWPKQAEKQAP